MITTHPSKLHVARCESTWDDCRRGHWYLTDGTAVADHRTRHYATRVAAVAALAEADADAIYGQALEATP